MIENTNIYLTKNAADKIISSSKKNNNKLMLRIRVTGGGCAGFQYLFNFESKINNTDKVFKSNNAKIVIDNASLKIIKTAKIDYVEEIIGSNFIVINKNASFSCGCGNSFSI